MIGDVKATEGSLPLRLAAVLETSGFTCANIQFSVHHLKIEASTVADSKPQNITSSYNIEHLKDCVKMEEVV